MDQSILHVLNFYVEFYIPLKMFLVYIHVYHLSKINKIFQIICINIIITTGKVK